MTQESKKPHIEELVTNKKAYFDYEVLETYETGIVLQGTEIKSLRSHGASLQEAYIIVDKGELWLIASSIAPYKFGSFYNHEEKRKRKLLAHKKEIRTIEAAIAQKGLTCMPLSIYIKNGIVKLKIGICRGKKQHDKREKLQERDDKRAMDRMMKSRNS